MATVEPAASLQDSAHRYARALIVPSKLLALHPRQAGGVGDAAALAPAITLGVISAFEGFMEDFFATALRLKGLTLAQIAKRVDINNPGIDDLEKLAKREFPGISSKIGVGFSVTIWSPPAIGIRQFDATVADWQRAKKDGKGWMQVRHNLSHGITSGWKSEVWPGPLKENEHSVPASSVLKPMNSGKHSLVLHGAITCARIYQAAGQHLANCVAEHMGEALSWSRSPDFPMYKKSYAEYLAENGSDRSSDRQ
ncbi:hypothetical protein ACIBCD_22085 [Nocardia brasiliensis]|uniref:hypothetical protein n=1 Tax=Nocardia brasiliensis TaxID=37326 RepID=UPI0037A89A1B